MGKTHIAMVPSPAFGHRAPMLDLARLVASHGFLVTLLLIKVEEEGHIHGTIQEEDKEEEEGLRLISMYIEVSNGEYGSWGAKSLLMALEELGPSILNALHRLRPPPVDCMIVDSSLLATKHASQHLGIPLVGFCPHMASIFSIFRSLPIPELPFNGVIKEEREISSFPGIRSISTKDLPWFSVKDDEMESFHGSVLRAVKNLEGEQGMKWLLCNSVYELERSAMNALMNTGVPLLPIGPLFLAPLGSNTRSEGSNKRSDDADNRREASDERSIDENNWSKDGNYLSVCPWPEDRNCLEWLDGQSEESVVFVSFGNTTIIDEEQLGEIALGLEASGRPFLWVLRLGLVNKEGTTIALLPEGFLERTKGRSRLVSWVAQKRVLGHPAVGAFLTHCGWNSTMESIAMGVPLLAWPYFGDQPFNSCYATLEWKVGLAFHSKLSKGGVGRDEVEGMIRRLMETEEGEEIRKRCHAWRDILACVVQVGGSSHTSFHKFIHYLKTLSHG